MDRAWRIHRAERLATRPVETEQLIAHTSRVGNEVPLQARSLATRAELNRRGVLRLQYAHARPARQLAETRWLETAGHIAEHGPVATSVHHETQFRREARVRGVETLIPVREEQ